MRGGEVRELRQSQATLCPEAIAVQMRSGRDSIRAETSCAVGVSRAPLPALRRGSQASEESAALIQVSDHVVTKEGEWSLTYFGYTLNVEQVEFADGFNNGCEREKKKVKIWGLSKWKNKVVIK